MALAPAKPDARILATHSWMTFAMPQKMISIVLNSNWPVLFSHVVFNDFGRVELSSSRGH